MPGSLKKTLQLNCRICQETRLNCFALFPTTRIKYTYGLFTVLSKGIGWLPNHAPARGKGQHWYFHWVGEEDWGVTFLPARRNSPRWDSGGRRKTVHLLSAHNRPWSVVSQRVSIIFVRNRFYSSLVESFYPAASPAQCIKRPTAVLQPGSVTWPPSPQNRDAFIGPRLSSKKYNIHLPDSSNVT